MLFKILIIFSCTFASIYGELINNKISDDCDENFLSCQGIKLLSTVVNQAIQRHHKRNIEIMNGVYLVESHTSQLDNFTNTGRNVRYDGNLLDNIENYLQTHEVRVNLLDLTAAVSSFIDGSQERSSSMGTGRGKKGGGYGAILLLGGAMAKMLMAAKLGLIAAIAGKALMTAMIAIVISSIIGLKKLASSGHEESGHQVIYAGHHDGHRRKRDTSVNDDTSIPLPYRGWINSFNQFKNT